MGILGKSLLWSVKMGTAGGALYVVHRANLFGSAEEAQQGYAQLKVDVQEGVPHYVPKEVLEYVPEVPQVDVKSLLPEGLNFNIEPDVRGLWNKGVLLSFGALLQAPEATKTYANDLVIFIQKQMGDDGKK